MAPRLIYCLITDTYSPLYSDCITLNIINSEFLLDYHAKHLRLDTCSTTPAAASESTSSTNNNSNSTADTTDTTDATLAISTTTDDVCSSATTAASTARYFEEQLSFVQELVDIAERLRFVEPVTSRGEHLKVSRAFVTLCLLCSPCLL